MTNGSDVSQLHLTWKDVSDVCECAVTILETAKGKINVSRDALAALYRAKERAHDALQGGAPPEIRDCDLGDVSPGFEAASNICDYELV